LKVKKLSGAGFSHEQIFSQARLNRYFDRDFIPKTNNFKSEEVLLLALEKSLEIESIFKSSKLADPKSSLKALIVKMFSSKK
jgi:hypothetical protein